MMACIFEAQYGVWIGSDESIVISGPRGGFMRDYEREKGTGTTSGTKAVRIRYTVTEDRHKGTKPLNLGIRRYMCEIIPSEDRCHLGDVRL